MLTRALDTSTLAACLARVGKAAIDFERVSDSGLVLPIASRSSSHGLDSALTRDSLRQVTEGASTGSSPRTVRGSGFNASSA